MIIVTGMPIMARRIAMIASCSAPYCSRNSVNAQTRIMLMVIPDRNMLLNSNAVMDLSSGRIPKRVNHCSLVESVSVSAIAESVNFCSMPRIVVCAVVNYASFSGFDRDSFVVAGWFGRLAMSSFLVHRFATHKLLLAAVFICC